MRWPLAGIAACLMAADAAAQEAPPPVDGVATAKSLIENGAYESATTMLETRVAASQSDVEALFMLGMIAIAKEDYRRAIARFRQALVHAPDATRIRLELARAFYLAKDYENAFRQFQFARAGNPPAPVVAMIDRFLTAIRLEKNWSYSFKLSIAPDTNINNATSARETELFGLPFELSDEARRRSGLGVAVGGNIEVAPRIATAVRLRLGAAAQRREYSGRRFDDTTVAFVAGPRIILPRWDLSLVGTGFRRWFGRGRLNEGYGLRAEVTRYLDPRTALSLDASAQKIHYPRSSQQSGNFYSATFAIARALTASSSLTAQFGGAQLKARAEDLSSGAAFGRIGYYREFPGGYSIYVEPGFTRSTFDAPDPFFGKTRRDNLYEVQLAVLNRKIIVLSRFTPRIAYTFARRKSTIDLYSFTQHRFEAGITSSF